MSEKSTTSYESGISAFFVIVLFVLGGYFIMLKTQKIHPFTKKLNPAAYGLWCGDLVGVCNDMAAVSCRADRGGPLYYVNKISGEILGRCGGDCLEGVCDPNTCPPRAWTCTTPLRLVR